MSIGRAWSIGLVGLDGHVVKVEADLAQGIPAFVLVGMADAGMQEARDRVRAAIANSGLTWPQRRVTLALSPVAPPKRGSAHDLAMAVAILEASGALPAGRTDGVVLLGELGLDGRVRPVSGVLPAVLAATRAGVNTVVVPTENVAEAELVPDVNVVGVADLRSVLARLTTNVTAARTRVDPPTTPAATNSPDLADINGQAYARHCLEVAAAGGHHVFLRGPAAAGASMLAERLPTIMPDLRHQAAIETTMIHSVAGQVTHAQPLITRPPLRSPHHTTSLPALVGGGSGIARPGEVSLAHHGVLFLNDAPEFAPGHLDVLRQPLEQGAITIARSGGIARYPAQFLLVLGASSCPCGTAGSSGRDCGCPAAVRRRYLARISGPILDRIDLRVDLEPPRATDAQAPGESSASVRDRVIAARERAQRRLRDTPWALNSQVPARELRIRWPLPADVLSPAIAAVDTGRLSARGLDRVVRVAWTLADLDAAPAPTLSHVRRAVALRSQSSNPD